MTLILELPDKEEAALKAKAHLEGVSPEQYADSIVTTDEVLSEYLTFFSGSPDRLQQEAGMIVCDILPDSGIRVIPQSRATFTAGLELYHARPDKAYSLIDCISMQTMRREGLTDVLTNDRHFEQEGFRALFRS